MIQTISRLAIISVIIAISLALIGTVSFSWTLNTSPYLKGLTDFLHIIYFVLPIDKLLPVINIFVASVIFRIVISIIKTLWNLLPVRG